MADHIPHQQEQGPGQSSLAVLRAALPFLVRPRDVALHLPNICERQARALLCAGFAGPPLLVEGEPVVSRDRLLDAIDRRALTGVDLLDDSGESEPEVTP